MKGVYNLPTEIVELDNEHIKIRRTIIRDHPNPNIITGTTVYLTTCSPNGETQFIHVLSNKQALVLRDALTKVLSYEPKTTENPH